MFVFFVFCRKHICLNSNLRNECKRAESGKNIFSHVALRPNAGQGLLTLEVSRSHITTHHSL